MIESRGFRHNVMRSLSSSTGTPTRIAASETHAWCELLFPSVGWIGFDPASGICTTDRHIRVAIGLDNLGAAQVRGVHFGGGHESVEVKLAVILQAGWQTQG